MESNEFNVFLSQAKTYTKNISSFRKVLVVLGNESCDLDSAISSLVYSLLLNKSKTKESVVIPVFNIPRAHLPVKTEVVYFLSKFKISLDNVICRDEIDLEELINAGALALTLVDHHVLKESDSVLATSVVTVIDHRPQDPAWPWTNTDITLSTVGSCCTLITKKLLFQTPDIISHTVAVLLLGTILLDTACLSPAAGKATPLDGLMADALEVRCDCPVARDELFRELQAARSDISSLTSSQILIKDMKVTAGIPICGLPIKVKEFLKRRDINRTIAEFCEVYNTTICVLYGSEFTEGTVTRDLAVYNQDDESAAFEIVEALRSNKEPYLDLQPQPSCPVKGVVLFEQCNIEVTRKQILPIVRQIRKNMLGAV